MMISPIDTTALDAGAVSTSGMKDRNTDPQAMQDRFLKLLVAQLTNQDPMNPMDNAQMTTQMAQINTVTGLQQLNLTMQSMAQQFAAMQEIQGVSLIGRSVLTEGDRLALDDAGQASGRFDLAEAASSVTVEIVTPGGVVVGTVDLGAVEGGRRSFEWDASGYTGNAQDLHFRVQANNGETAVATRTLNQTEVVSTGSDGGRLLLTLADGSVTAYSSIHGVI